MARAIELAISGLSLGGIYALVAFAMSLTISTTRILNVAHGVFFVWGGAFFVILSQRLGLHPAVAMAILVALFFAFALLFQWFIVRPLLGRSVHLLLVGSILATFGLAQSMEGARAMAQNFDGFVVIGLNPYRLSMILFSLAIVATAISGAFYVLAVPLNPYEGLPLTLKAFTVVVLAGVGNLPATLVAGAVLGTAEVITSQFVGTVWAPAVSLTLLFLVLVFKPTGFFGKGVY